MAHRRFKSEKRPNQLLIYVRWGGGCLGAITAIECWLGKFFLKRNGLKGGISKE